MRESRSGQSTESSAPVTPKGRSSKEALLRAGGLVAERRGIAGLSVAAVTREAGLAKATFYVYFPDRESFIDALHQRFYKDVNEAVAAAVLGLPPGRAQLLAAIEAYLDVCLENRAVKALVFETRAQSSLTTTMEEREAMFVQLAEPCTRAMKLKPAQVFARLAVALASETALIEMESARKVPGARKAIGALLAAPAQPHATKLERRAH
jgi:TetR/AcrR family transcriptional regulator, transcriptional repressor for nem operon